MKKLFLLAILGIVSLSSFAADYWRKITIPTDKHLLCISFGSELVGYIGGSDSTLLKTTDGGKTWTSVKATGLLFSDYTPDLMDIHFVSSTTGFAILSDKENPEFRGTICKTTDGGSTWTTEAVSMAAYCGFFFDEHTGFVAGSGFFSGSNISRQVGGTWMAPAMLSPGSGSFLRTIDFYNANTGIVGGDSGYVHRTFDGGITWDTVKTNIDTIIHGLLYVSEDTIIAVTANIGAAVLISTDKGKTWKFDPGSATFYYPDMKAIAVSRKDSLIMVGRSITTGKGIIYHYPSGPFMNIADADQNLNDVAMADDSIAFIVGDSGLLLSNIHIGTGFSEQKTPRIQISIFPNPASRSFFTQSNEEHTVSVFDLGGRNILQSSHPAKGHQINMSGHPAGIYLVCIVGDHDEQFWSRLILE